MPTGQNAQVTHTHTHKHTYLTPQTHTRHHTHAHMTPHTLLAYTPSAYRNLLGLFGTFKFTAVFFFTIDASLSFPKCGCEPPDSSVHAKKSTTLDVGQIKTR